MAHVYDAVRLTDRVYWVGAIDWGIREFHGYATGRGTTYNAYLVMDETVTLVDTVKARFAGEMLGRIASVTDPAGIDLIISNHSEMDHTGCLPQVVQATGAERVLASRNGVKALQAHFHGVPGLEAVADGQTVSLGATEATFVETRMLHWPDSMMTYLSGEEILFSQDGFGMHLASTERYADQLAPDIITRELAKYYANILLPFSNLVTRAVASLREMDLPLAMIAPDHGPVFRENLAWVLDAWARWAEQKPTRKAVVVYDTMWHSTEGMARAVAEGLLEGGATSVRVMPLASSHRSDVATEVLEAGALLVGSPTINNTVFPTVADVLTYLEGLSRQNLVGAAFGSYGWNGKAVGQLEDWLRRMNVELVAEAVKVHYVPDDDALARCRALGRQVGLALKQRVGSP
ncbi:MAG: flavodoxin domain-containing protein [Planctomycetota bacterium]|nr:flavodoxin domain-containing protein [Planctomycetota bacterium]